MKNIGILGSTGSIGTQALEIVRKNHDLKVCALAAGGNVLKMEEQVREFKPRLAVMWTEEAARELRARVADTGTKVAQGMEGLLEIAVREDLEVLVTAVVGMIGIKPTIAAIKAGKTIALANKETLVTAGHIIMPLAEEKHIAVLPVDSEHSAIFQCLHKEKKDRAEKILLTASGGPFRGKKRQELGDITVEDALRHPNWSMGQKITVDSATLVNKGLEVMEAKWLFAMEPEKIQVVVHPQSIIHSMVEFADGGIMAQLGLPDMKLPIQYALFYPDRRPMAGRRVDFYELGTMTFERPDMETFRGLGMAYAALREGGSMPAVYNAANERAVSLFLGRKIKFLEIYDLIQGAMECHRTIQNPSVEEILAAEAEAYDYINTCRRL
ncbi:1-deoxy-D-xylulose 5-phosphate reductoisomerase [Lachnospiraceae bacterium]|nr:1-deoxy-D-xylulose 5-phosphate reductoisomerase [Lachnospiraceae bacterium]